MRIIAGKYKRRLIEFPKIGSTRPMQDRVKESIFNILTEKCMGAKVLDLFSGSGSMGLEAFSRGAKEVTFIDANKICIDVIKRNIRTLDIESGFSVVKSDVLKAIGRLGQEDKVFDLIFLDPPYHHGLIEKSLIEIEGCGIITNSGLIVAHHFKKETVPEEIGSLRLVRQNLYGDKLISFYNIFKSKGLGE
jgi:16S rRNA (guanine(966)-N(2))-methyltransferase RsmD